MTPTLLQIWRRWHRPAWPVRPDGYLRPGCWRHCTG